MPLIWSAGGGLHVMVAEREVEAVPPKLSGLALGTNREHAGYDH